MSKDKIHAPSLLDLFRVPEDFWGSFGWICGYSGDCYFFDRAAEFFTGCTASTLEKNGNIHLVAMLNGGKAQNCEHIIRSGVFFPRLLKNKWDTKLFRLLHAKVTILGFEHKKDPQKWLLRLIVSTGNWTRQTIEESLDLACQIDVTSEELNLAKDAQLPEIMQNCADIKAAWDFLEYIQPYFDLSVLSENSESFPVPFIENKKKFKIWVEEAVKKAKGKTRFIDSRKKPLLEEILDRLSNQQTNEIKRKYLAIGSGFYETITESTSSKKAELPKVLKTIIDKLKKKALHPDAKIDIFVNPTACQGIADINKEIFEHNKITIYPAKASESVFGKNSQRNLHAKFIYAANINKKSNKCNELFVYIGSGNMTHAGFINNPKKKGSANLEAGMFFFPNNIFYKTTSKNSAENTIENRFPIQVDNEVTVNFSTLKNGDKKKEEEYCYALPISCFLWKKNHLLLKEPYILDVEATKKIQVFDTDNNPCFMEEDNGEYKYIWNSEKPRFVNIVCKENDEAEIFGLVPVIDEFGRIAASVLPQIDIQQAMEQLFNFPLPLEEVGDESESSVTSQIVWKNGCQPHLKNNVVSAYPIRSMMEFIEKIAAVQTSEYADIVKANWKTWCSRLNSTLDQIKDSEDVAYFRDKLQINPLSPLYVSYFYPDFLDEEENQELKKHYKDMLDKIEKLWNIKDKKPLG